MRIRRVRTSRRPGVAYLLTMLYLMLFSILAIGLAAASTLSVQLADADRCAADAQSAAESGLEVVRARLGQIGIQKGTSGQQLMDEISRSLEKPNDPNDRRSLRYSEGRGLTRSDPALRSTSETGVPVPGHEQIALPSPDEWLAVDPTLGTKFQAQLTVQGSTVVARIIGQGRGDLVRKAVQLQFELKDTWLVPVPGSYLEVSP